MGDEKRLQELGADVLETDEDNSDEEEKACEVAHKSEWEIWRDDQARRHEKRKRERRRLAAHRCRCFGEG